MFYPESTINILGVPTLGKFFGDKAYVQSTLAEDGTTLKYGTTKSHLVWEHGKHKHHFMHGSRQMPEIYLYAGYGYFNAFCTCIYKLLRDKVHYPFSSAYFID